MTDPLLLRHPIVLVHGLGARSSYGPFEYFHGLPKRLRLAGNSVLVANLKAWQTIESRAEQLKKQIDEAFPDGGKINLIGHSMGGLDARYVVATLGLHERTASVTTIGTPNRGTTLSDISFGLIPDETFNKLDLFLESFESSTRAFRQISRSFNQEKLAETARMMPGIAYFSATTVIRDPAIRNSLPLFWLTHKLLRKYEGPNDGFVSEETAQFGEHLMTEYGDHYSQIGQFFGLSRGLDYVAFQDKIIARLKSEGF